MKIYIFRHAQKAMDFSTDPDLAADGYLQAQKLVDRVMKGELPRPNALWVSPKKRTCATFRALSEELKVPMVLEEALLEQNSNESHSSFLNRIRNLCEKAGQQKTAVLFLCTHYDWVLEAVQVLPSDILDPESSEFSNWAPCQYIGFDVEASGFFKFLEVKRIQI